MNHHSCHPDHSINKAKNSHQPTDDSIVYDTKKTSVGQKAMISVKWLVIVAVMYAILILMGIWILHSPAMYQGFKFLIAHRSWLLLVCQLVVIVSAYWWYPLVTHKIAQQKGYSEGKLQEMLAKRWHFIGFLVVLALISRLIFQIDF